MAENHNDPGTASSGNQNERLEISSGTLVVIDHYMLACPPFRDSLKSQGIRATVPDYGGLTVALPAGSYSVLRNPFDRQILVCPLGSCGEDFSLDISAYREVGKVLIDTRCLLFIDEQHLLSSALLEEYRELWLDGTAGQKKARDFIRAQGGAVRYGFSRGSEEIFLGTDGDRLALWC